MSEPSALPTWVVQLVAGLAEHEDTHAAGDGSCMAGLLERVPREVMLYAEGWSQGLAHARRTAAPS